jgi:hypothetical protein
MVSAGDHRKRETLDGQQHRRPFRVLQTRDCSPGMRQLRIPLANSGLLMNTD